MLMAFMQEPGRVFLSFEPHACSALPLASNKDKVQWVNMKTGSEKLACLQLPVRYNDLSCELFVSMPM